jgi:hypothetical protein
MPMSFETLRRMPPAHVCAYGVWMFGLKMSTESVRVGTSG